MKKTIIIGYGNPDRQDDGAAWYVLATLARMFHQTAPQSPEDEFEAGANPQLVFMLQLTPEMAETLSNYEQVCFVDAHTGSMGEDLCISVVEPEFQQTPFTHHFSPQSCLSLAQSLYHACPRAVLVTVKGHEFQFSRELTEKTAQLTRQAAEYIFEWTNNPFLL